MASSGLILSTERGSCRGAKRHATMGKDTRNHATALFGGRVEFFPNLSYTYFIYKGLGHAPIPLSARGRVLAGGRDANAIPHELASIPKGRK
jgi:hypothetical protein